MNTQHKPSKNLAISMWMIASIFYAYQYVIRVLPNIFFQEILERFHIDAVTFGQFSGVYYIGYALMHVPLGIMMDRFGPKKMLPICIFMTVIGLLPMVFAKKSLYLVLGRFLVGIGSSAAALGMFKIIRHVFEEKRFTQMLSFSVTIGLIGAIYGGGPVNYLQKTMGSEKVILLFAVLGMMLAFLSFWVLPSMGSRQRRSIRKDIVHVFTNKKFIFTCLCAGCLVGPLEGFSDMWATAYLEYVYGWNNHLASSIPSMIFVGMCFGGPILVFIANRNKNDFMTMMFAGAIMAIVFFALSSLWLSPMILAIGFIAVGVCSAYQVIAIYKASSYLSSQYLALSTAAANTIIMIFGYFIHSCIGFVVHMTGGETSRVALHYGSYVVPTFIILGIAGFGILLMGEKRKPATLVR